MRAALVRYARWLRTRDSFPVRVPVYLHPYEYLVTIEGKTASASFFAPYGLRVEPYIRIATGDFAQLKRRYGRNNAVAPYLCSLNHELLHYWQWLATGEVWERGVVRAASVMLRRYQQHADRP